MCDESSRPPKKPTKPIKANNFLVFFSDKASGEPFLKIQPILYTFVTDAYLLIISFPVRTGIIPKVVLFFQKTIYSEWEHA